MRRCDRLFAELLREPVGYRGIVITSLVISGRILFSTCSLVVIRFGCPVVPPQTYRPRISLETRGCSGLSTCSQYVGRSFASSKATIAVEIPNPASLCSIAVEVVL